MKLDELVDEIRQAVEIIKVKLDHTVTWKELSGTALTLFLAICAGVWFLVQQIVEAKLSGAEARLNSASITALDSAKKELITELRATLGEISQRLETNATSLMEVSALLEKQSQTTKLTSEIASKFVATTTDLSLISDLLAEQKNTNPAYVTFDSAGPIGAKLLSSPEWDKFAKTWGLDKQLVIDTGQIIVPFGDIKLLTE